MMENQLETGNNNDNNDKVNEEEEEEEKKLPIATVHTAVATATATATKFSDKTIQGRTTGKLNDTHSILNAGRNKYFV